jgi:probable F420-dependent oxidoreductase
MTNNEQWAQSGPASGPERGVSNPEFGPVGVWLTRRLISLDEVVEIAQTAEQLKFGGLWIAGGELKDIFEDIRTVIAATDSLPIGSSIINMYTKGPAEVTAAFWELEREFPHRFYLGVGPSHAPVVDKSNPGQYVPPLRKTRTYFEGLDAEVMPIPLARRVIPAIGPMTLAFAAKHSRGSIPYNMPVAHTSFAREKLGAEPLLATELGIVLSDDLSAARARAREFLTPYLPLPNYTEGFLRHGFEASDLENGGSDRLVDGLFGLGGAEKIGARISEHLDAGADQVAIQVLPLPGQTRVEVLTEVARERRLGS